MPSITDLLPTYLDIVTNFGLFGGDDGKECHVEVQAGGVISCSCWGCRRWRLFCEGRLLGCSPRPQYEVLTQELIISLAQYIRVLEVGAGDGRLTWHLRQALGAGGGGGLTAEIACIDDGCLGLHRHSPYGGIVELQDTESAVRERAPHLVLCCWMPLGVDWSAAFRAQSSVREYLLIGETDSGICGCPWRTWGADFEGFGDSGTQSILREGKDERDANRSFVGSPSDQGATYADSDSSIHPVKNSLSDALPQPPSAANPCVLPLYAVDRFQRVNMCVGEDAEWPLQICRQDERWSLRHRSHSVAFRRDQLVQAD